MAFFRKAADVAHKTAVTGLFGLFLWGGYNLGGQVLEGWREKQHRESLQAGAGGGGAAAARKAAEESHPQAGVIQMLRDKAKEEYSKYYDIGHREWYDKEDDSYLKNLPKPKDYENKRG
uniref:Uncharacterized protein n=1 Tax=Trieres chinensis TaxID=1514140 RepID=A0A7S2EVN7_TRICV|mmetsp:Transcript_3916/g.8322  ORF Transcript_3916/g.8322 Transcript_3916/m.8322 type:complete len:119 (+) Transcript_3916:352-708(+)